MPILFQRQAKILSNFAKMDITMDSLFTGLSKIFVCKEVIQLLLDQEVKAYLENHFKINFIPNLLTANLESWAWQTQDLKQMEVSSSLL